MIVVVDHEDSFVYNLVQQVQVLGHEVLVLPSRASVDDVLGRSPAGVLLSPGPGRPEAAGCFVELIQALPATTPLLGVCLGHQALAAALGGQVVHAPRPVHGRTSEISHQGAGVLAGLPAPFAAGRYHSLVVERDGLPEELEVTATSEDGLIMAMRHRSRPWFGVQFHPESVLTPLGSRLMANFLRMARPAAPAGGA
ncbi:MAG: aminodeoxychorismate/anthranilate synthase component II [Candidatus Dormibacteraeota bacterium]|nr:aminodeoxychorismate/anthranilate synthase component II [Candidatus Dormibacteraeota bacterium]